MIKFIKNKMGVIFLAPLLVFPSLAHAAGNESIFGLFSLDDFTDPSKFFNLTDGGGLAVFIKNLTNLLLTIGEMAAIVMVIWAGLTMVLSAGNPEKIQGAKKVLTAAAIGLLIIIGAQVIVNIVVNVAGGAIQ